jgi:hypothetical protein
MAGYVNKHFEVWEWTLLNTSNCAAVICEIEVQFNANVTSTDTSDMNPRKVCLSVRWVTHGRVYISDSDVGESGVTVGGVNGGRSVSGTVLDKSTFWRDFK